MKEHELQFPQIIAFVLNKDFVVKELSPAAENYLGKSASSILNQPITKLLPETHPIIKNMHRAGRFSLYDERFYLLNSSAELFDIHQFESDTHITIFLYPKPSHRDLDFSRAVEGAKQQTANMAAMLAHEVRNPLGAIKGAAQLLAVDADASSRDLLRVIEEETTRITKMVNSFEDIAGDNAPNVEAVNIHQILSQMLRAIKVGYGRHIEISEDYDPSLPEVAADPDRLQRALSNILKNAVEAIQSRFVHPEEQGRIKIQSRYRRGIRRSDEFLPVEISIADNGGGIDESILHDVFKPFVTTKTNGTGLGLSMVARIIEEIGGVIEVDNVQQGSRFRILLPIWRQ